MMILYLIVAALPPILYRSNIELAAYIREFGSVICHQRPSRCLWLNDYPCGLCAKCLGFYLGVWFSTIIFLVFGLVLRGLFSLVITMPFIYLMIDSFVIKHAIVLPAENIANVILAIVAGFGMYNLFLNVLALGGRGMFLVRRHIGKIFTVIIIINLILISYAFAEDEESVPEKPQKIVVPAGTGVILQIEGGVTTKETREGDSVSMHVVSPVRVNDIVVVRSGTPAKGLVAMSRSASSWGGAGELVIEVKYTYTIDGSELMLTGSSSRRGETSHGASAAVAVGTGILCLPLALTGAAVKGEEGRILPGYEIVARTINDQTVRILSESEQIEIQKKQEEISTKQRIEAEERANKQRGGESKKKSKSSTAE